MIKTSYLHLPILLLFVPLFATDEIREAAFFDSVKAMHLRDYRECTGDMSDISVKRLLEWKKQMDMITRNPEYTALLREFRASADSTVDALPCKVTAWAIERKKKQLDKEKSMVADLLIQEEFDDAQKEINGLPKTSCDFPGFPFGLSKKSFLLMFKHLHATAPIDMDNHVYVNTITWGERPFLTGFFFDTPNGFFYKYEIESVGLPAEQLNRAVRSDAHYLAGEFEKIFGEPARRESIGYFDIKKGVLSPYKTWDIPGFFVCVGISMNDYKYYAKAVVAKNGPPKTVDSSAQIK
jgi:hypothetical protein